MKQYLVIFATVATLALPGLVGAQEKSAPAGEPRGQVDASALADLLVQKRLITPEEEKAVTHRTDAPTDERTLQQYFDTGPYHREGWQGGS